MLKGFLRQRSALKIAAKNGLKKKKDHAVIEATHQATQADTRPKFAAEAALRQMANTTKVAKLAAFGSTVTVVWSGTDFLKMQRISYKLVYYPPGWVGRFHTGLGEGWAERGFDIAGRFPKLADAEIHVGSEDWQSNPENVLAFGDAVDIPVTVVPGGGHMLDIWLPQHGDNKNTA